jgi:hypothetical protein
MKKIIIKNNLQIANNMTIYKILWQVTVYIKINLIKSLINKRLQLMEKLWKRKNFSIDFHNKSQFIIKMNKFIILIILTAL